MAIKGLWISRRAFLMGGGKIAAYALLAPAAVQAAVQTVADEYGTAATGELDVRFTVIDRRFPLSVAYTKGNKGEGGEHLDVGSGLTRLWQDKLEPLWQQGGGAVVGVTTRAVWQCLAEQARSHGLQTRVLTPLQGNDGHPDNLVYWIIA